jgi:hypothetical protein
LNQAPSTLEDRRVATFILTWDSEDDGYEPLKLAGDITETSRGRAVQDRWSMGPRRGGTSRRDRVFLLRQHRDRGIIGSGRLTDGDIYPGEHWRDPARMAWYADITWDRVLSVADRLPFEQLLDLVPGHHWNNIMSSGQKVVPPADAQLEAAWAAHLARLDGPPDWSLPVGGTLSRRDRMRRYGGGLYGGIEPSRKTPNIFLYSDPAAGHAYGYHYDGWTPDGSVFLYTGEGTRLDQQLRDGNAAVLRHAANGRALRLFVADGTETDSNTKVQRYIGEFRIDPEQPHLSAEAPDHDGNGRIVFVFRLHPIGQVLRRDQDRSSAGDAASYPLADQVPVETAATTPGTAEAVPLEAAHTTTYAGSSTAITAVRREAELSRRYQAYLAKQGRSCVRYKLRPPGELCDLYTDLFDKTRNILYEVKGVSTREAVRMAIGQLLDYRRHIPTKPATAVLLPARPTDDLLDLLANQNIGCVHETESGQYETVL